MPVEAGFATATAARQEPGIAVFRRFLDVIKVGDEIINVDASRVVSKECYKQWLKTRIGVKNEPERTFQRALTAHLTGSDGRQVFLPEEEAAILKVVRAKRVWFVLNAFWGFKRIPKANAVNE